MRGDVTVSAWHAGQSLGHGWEDVQGAGVFDCAPRGPEHGAGGVGLCLELPEEVWQGYDITALVFSAGERLARVPAGVLSRLGPPRR